MILPPLMSLLLRMKTELWHYADPKYWVRLRYWQRNKGVFTPHMLTGFPSASNGVRFLLNFLPPMKGSTKITKVIAGFVIYLLS